MPTSFGDWLKHQRKAQALTHEALAQRVGCDQVILRKIEYDEFRPSLQITIRLLKALSVANPELSPLISLARGTPTERVAGSTLPSPTTPLLGRETAVDDITELLQAHHRLVTLTGPGGIGKTRLSIEVATMMQHVFADGCFFVDLAPIRDAHLVLRTIAQVLGIPEQTAKPILATLIQALQTKHLLLVLDNLEQVLDSAADIAALLAGIPGLSVLATSRARLHLKGEYAYNIPPLALPSRADLEYRAPDRLVHLADSPAVALFIERATMALHSFTVTAETLPIVAAICMRLDGLPLAIELAAARITIFSPQTLLQRLEHQLPLLVSSTRDLPERHQTLRAAIRWSYTLLRPEEQALFEQLAVFSGGCTLEAIIAVVQEADGESDDDFAIVARIEALLDHSLLVPYIGAQVEQRFVMLETIRQYALEQLQAHGEAASVLSRHSKYYLALTEKAHAELERAAPAIWLDQLEAEHDNIRAALRWDLSPAGEPNRAVALAGAAWNFWMMRGFATQGIQWLKAALDAAPTAPISTRALALRGLGWLLNERPEAQPYLLQSLELYKQIPDPRNVADILRGLSRIATRMGDIPLARTYLTECLQIVQTLDNTALKGWTILTIGQLLMQERKMVEAAARCDESLELFQADQNHLGIGWVQINIASSSKSLFDYPKGLRAAEQAILAFQHVGELRGVGLAMLQAANIVLAQGDTAKAQAWCDESCRVDETFEGGQNYAFLKLLEGHLAQLKGDTASARSHYIAGRKWLDSAGDQELFTSILHCLSAITLQDGDAVAAIALLDISIALSANTPLSYWHALSITLRDATLVALNAAQGIAQLEQDLAHFRAIDHPWGIIYTLRFLGTSLLDIGRDADAAAYLYDGLMYAQTLTDHEGLFVILVGLAYLALRRGEVRTALALGGASEQWAARLGSGYIKCQLFLRDRQRYYQLCEELEPYRNDPQLADAWAHGQISTREAIIAMAQEFASAPSEILVAPTSPTSIAPPSPDLDTFAYSVSHDLRAPLHTITGFAAILQEDYGAALGDDAQRVIGVIQHEAERMEQLISDLLAYARVGFTPEQHEHVDMTALAHTSYTELTAHLDRSRIDMQLEPLPPALGDTILLRQVWVNLIGNALKYSSKRPQALITIQGTIQAESAVYRIQDNGAGFDPRYAKKLFGIFQRLHSDREFPGTGVGLAMVHRIITRHGGQIWAESELGQGATFTFRLPTVGTRPTSRKTQA